MCNSTEAAGPAEPETLSAPKTRSHKTMTDEDFDQLPAENIDWEELGTENRELLYDWSRRKEQELIDVATQCQHASSVSPIGRDRFFRCYWVFRSVPGLLVEENTTNFCAFEPSWHLNGPLSNNFPANCSSGVEVSARSQTHWSVYGSVEDVDQLLDSLNARGLREGPLRAALVEQRDRLKEWVGKCDLAALSTPTDVSQTRSVSAVTSVSAVENDSLVSDVREMILDLEERIYSGCLGSLKV